MRLVRLLHFMKLDQQLRWQRLLTGYQEDAVRIGEVKIDEPMKIGNTPKNHCFNQRTQGIPK